MADAGLCKWVAASPRLKSTHGKNTKEHVTHISKMETRKSFQNWKPQRPLQRKEDAAHSKGMRSSLWLDSAESSGLAPYRFIMMTVVRQGCRGAGIKAELKCTGSESYYSGLRWPSRAVKETRAHPLVSPALALPPSAASPFAPCCLSHSIRGGVAQYGVCRQTAICSIDWSHSDTSNRMIWKQ